MASTFSARAQGRVNLIGEHTDYNGGWVLPTSIPQYTEVSLRPREDFTVIVESSGGRKESYRLGEESPTQNWHDYVQGTTKFLGDFARARGKELRGFEVLIQSTIPEGSGLSSSAALEMSLLKALRKAFAIKATEVELALLGQKVENEFVGARVGIMDQMACGLARDGEALFLDTLKLSYERIKLPLESMDLIVINSGISHRLSEGEGGYNQRRAECEEACKLLGIEMLREIDLAGLMNKSLPERLMKRARHVVTENARVHAAVEALRMHDLFTLGELFRASHISMRDDYQVSLPEIDLLVELCGKDEAVYGARLTGGGFGGSIVAITKKGQGSRVAREVSSRYSAETNIPARILI